MIDLKNITLLTTDSKAVELGAVFFALKGAKNNGEDYVDEALKAGAAYVIASHECKGKYLDDERVVGVANPRKELAYIAAKFYHLQPKNIVAVTGTNGKTSTVNFYHQICEYNALHSASIGTLGIVSKAADIDFDNSKSMTSPDPITMHKLLSNLAQQNVNYVAIEASSHGLDQHRLDGVKIRVAGFTNFTRDHLDYHANMQEYFLAKARLFQNFNLETAVLNCDIEEFQQLKGICEQRNIKIITYGKLSNDIKILTCENEVLKLQVFGSVIECAFKLYGDFQIYNACCALGLAIATDIPQLQAIKALSHLQAASGRLEKVGDKRGAKIFVDYAHTPDALQSAITSLRPFCKGQLHVLFGCGGDRDPGKRSIMGEIAAKFADAVIVTDDNPRTEDAANIRAQVLKNAQSAIEIADRDLAIKFAIEQLKPDDVLLIAGKGHENYQIIGTTKYYFSDQKIVEKYLASN